MKKTTIIFLVLTITGAAVLAQSKNLVWNPVTPRPPQGMTAKNIVKDTSKHTSAAAKTTGATTTANNLKPASEASTGKATGK